MRSTAAGTVCSTLHGFQKKQGRFKPFEDVYGQPTDDHARPSYSAVLEKHNEENVLHRQLLVCPKVRDVVQCADCNKPRCVYAATKLTTVQQRIVKRRKEDNTYTCGSTLFASDNQYVDTLIVRESL